jgi:hypothetical protein
MIAHKSLAFAAFDYQVSRRGVLVGFVEVKNRDAYSTDYPTWLIAASKITWAAHWIATTGVGCKILYGWADGVWAVNVAGLIDGGRVNLSPHIFTRPGRDEAEPVYWIPRERAVKVLVENPAR